MNTENILCDVAYALGQLRRRGPGIYGPGHEVMQAIDALERAEAALKEPVSHPPGCSCGDPECPQHEMRAAGRNQDAIIVNARPDDKSEWSRGSRTK